MEVDVRSGYGISTCANQDTIQSVLKADGQRPQDEPATPRESRGCSLENPESTRPTGRPPSLCAHKTSLLRNPPTSRNVRRANAQSFAWLGAERAYRA